MDDIAAEWLTKVEERFGSVVEIRMVRAHAGAQPISVLFFETGKSGQVRAVTFGLSQARRTAWRLAKPELMVIMNSTHPEWGLAAGYFASRYFGRRDFSYGETFMMEQTLAPDTMMQGMLVFAPAVDSEGEQIFEISRSRIVLGGLYPIYHGEDQLVKEWGLEKFWKERKGFDPFDPHRPAVNSGWSSS
ncbi:MAG: suppressor of fused domain protein [Leptospiraceae bacterium]|nr:suppressor of fused domain protein [Leptospiraceae bacterium]